MLREDSEKIKLLFLGVKVIFTFKFSLETVQDKLSEIFNDQRKMS